MTTCSQCQTIYTGHRAEHCMGCHRTFAGTDAGDRHRTGDHAISDPSHPDRRRCRTPEEMRAKGMSVNERGLWVILDTRDRPKPWSKKATDPAIALAATIQGPSSLGGYSGSGPLR